MSIKLNALVESWKKLLDFLQFIIVIENIIIGQIKIDRVNFIFWILYLIKIKFKWNKFIFQPDMKIFR